MSFKVITISVSILCGSICFGQETAQTAFELQQVLNSSTTQPIELSIVFKTPQNATPITPFSALTTNRDAHRQAVIQELEAQAEASQAEVLSLLKAEEAKGNVTNIEQFWIANTITCQATANVVNQLSNRADIMHLGLNKEVQLIFPEEIASTEGNEMVRASVLPHITQINADQVWDLGYTGKNIVVAIMDSGTNTDHYDIRNHLWRGYVDTNDDNIPDTWVNGWNFVANNSNITDDYKHGSHCAGIVAGDGSSGMRAGVAPDASIMTLKTVNRAGGGSPANMIKAVEFALKNGADVISMSIGFKNNQIDDATKAALRRTFENTLSAGVVACAAVGNDGDTYGVPNNVDVPASCPPPYLHPDQKAICEGGLTSIISVGSVNSSDEYVRSSSCGPSMWNIVIENQYQYDDYPYDGENSFGLIRPDICAPGEMILSLNYTQNNKYTMMSGTSMSTPCVAGVIALMLEKNPDLTPAQICEIIETTAKKLTTSKSNNTGSGRIDALAAINAVNASTARPYVRLSHYPTKAFTPGNNQELNIRLTNSGQGVWEHSAEQETITTLSTNDQYITIVDPEKTIDNIAAGQTTTLNYTIDISEETPNGHVAYFYVTSSNGTSSYTDKFRIQVNAEALLSVVSFSPEVLPKGINTSLSVTVQNTGNIPTLLNSKVILTSKTEGVTIISGEASVEPLDVNDTYSCDFEVKIDAEVSESDIRLSLQCIPNNYSQETSTIYEFEINPNDPVYDDGLCYWTTFDANSDYLNQLWPFWHSSLAKKNALANVGQLLHNGESHMISEAYCSASYIDPEYTIPTDNYLVSPKIKATANSQFSFWVRCHQNYSNPGEHFGVAISENSNNTAADFTVIQDWTTEGTEWKQYTVDLSQYDGKEIYVAIRHYYTDEQWIAADYGYNYYTLNIDDIKFEHIIDASFIFHDRNNSIFRVPISMVADINNLTYSKSSVYVTAGDGLIRVCNINGNATVSIYDISGRQVLPAYSSNGPEAVVDAEELVSGIYIVTVNDQSGITTHKIKLD